MVEISGKGIILIVISVIAISAVIAVCVAIRFLFEKSREKVIKESPRYLYLNSLQAEIGYISLEKCYYYSIPLNSKAQFDHADSDKLIMDYIKENPEIVSLTEAGLDNRILTSSFDEMVEHSPYYRSTNAYRIYDKVEHQLTDSLLQKITPVVPYFSFDIYYTSPQGRNHYSQRFKITIDDVLKYVVCIKNQREKRIQLIISGK